MNLIYPVLQNMKKGIIYIMTTAVSGLIKIGKTGSDNYQERMRQLESNGYSNVSGLKRFFAIEVSDYGDKENMIHDVFSKQQIAGSELFALDQEQVKQLLLAFEGKVVFPKNINQEKAFKEVTQSRKRGALFSFYRKGIQNGEEIVFIDDKSIKAKVVGEREVVFEGQNYKLSALVYKINEQKGNLSPSGAYQGAKYFLYKGKKLYDLKDK